MTTATVRDVQHNLAEILRLVEAGEEVIIRRRNRPVARIVPLAPAPARRVDWSDLARWRSRVFPEGQLPGKPLSELIADSREDR